MGNLTRDFNSQDFACKCCGKVSITFRVANAVQHLYDLSDGNLVVHSSYRCVKKNRAVGGATNSKHILGEAIDFHIEGYSVKKSLLLLIAIPEFMGIGIIRLG